MARPTLDYAPIKVVISASPKLIAYIDALVKKEAYGTTRPEVVKTACWRLIEELQKGNILKQVPDEVPSELTADSDT
jgi:hypothetical protein